MSQLGDCATCETCQELLGRINAKLIKIGDTRLYNIRFELGRHTDYDQYKLLMFYKQVVSDICADTDCDCYGTDTEPILERVKILLA